MKVFIGKSDIDGDRIAISKEDLHHLEKVLRVRDGEKVTACDGEFDYFCEFENRSLIIKSKRKCENENETHITIFQAVPKQSKMETIIQMASELGVDRIIPIKTEYCVADLPDEKKLERWRKIALESAMQCGRDKVLEIREGAELNRAIEMTKDLKFSFILHEKEKEKTVKDFDLSDEIGIFIGPEGGFSEKEIEMAKLPTVTLGKRILRTQTVAAVISSLILFIKGEI